MKQFAPQYERTDKNWILFPNDVGRRRELFTPESMNHNAKANVYMVESLVEYCSEPGDTVLDIFGGSGTLLVGALMRRDVTLFELNPEYADLIDANIDRVGNSSTSLCIRNPCQVALLKTEPNSIQAIITSPPYAGAFTKHSGTMKVQSAAHDTYQEGMQTYADDTQKQGNLSAYNLAAMTNFLFNQEMAKIYALSFKAIRPGGYFALIIKDRIKGGKRIELGLESVAMMMAAGFKMGKWERWEPSGSQFKKYAHAKGLAWVDEEHLIIMRKE